MKYTFPEQPEAYNFTTYNIICGVANLLKMGWIMFANLLKMEWIMFANLLKMEWIMFGYNLSCGKCQASVCGIINIKIIVLCLA